MISNSRSDRPASVHLVKTEVAAGPTEQVATPARPQSTVGTVSESGITQRKLCFDVDALVAAFMAEAPLEDIIPIVDRIAIATDHLE